MSNVITMLRAVSLPKLDEGPGSSSISFLSDFFSFQYRSIDALEQTYAASTQDRICVRVPSCMVVAKATRIADNCSVSTSLVSIVEMSPLEYARSAANTMLVVRALLAQGLPPLYCRTADREASPAPAAPTTNVMNVMTAAPAYTRTR